MNILFASTPATGHINPLLAITRILLAENHEITSAPSATASKTLERNLFRFRDAQISTGGIFLRWLLN
jgi:UDP:flavonoid glycosyltransferase YjiC (YdhE family)